MNFRLFAFERIARSQKDLSYQKEEQFMLHESPVLSVAFSKNGELLCSGDQKGCIKVWRYRSGKCIREYKNAHENGVTTLRFSRDGGQILSGSFDGMVRCHGLKSGRVLKEFRGHTSYVNCAIWLASEKLVLSGGSDGTVRLWDAKSASLVRTVRPPQRHAADEAAILGIAPFPQNVEHFVVTQETQVVLMTQEGQVIRSFHIDKPAGEGKPGEEQVGFAAACVSPRGEYVYGLGADDKLYAFQMETARIEESFAVGQQAIGLTHHPLQNAVATFGEDGTLKVWVP